MDTVSRLLWRVDNVELGRILYESIPSNIRPRWATDILRLCYHQLKENIGEVNNIIDIGSDQHRWGEAYEAFQSLRCLYLTKHREHSRMEQSNNYDLVFNSDHTDDKTQWQQEVILLFLSIAEIVAKIIYNASEIHTSVTSSAPFDYHAGWRMAPEVRRFVELRGSPMLEEEAWEKLLAHTPFKHSA